MFELKGLVNRKVYIKKKMAHVTNKFQKKNISRNVGHQLTFKTTWQNIIWSESI